MYVTEARDMRGVRDAWCLASHRHYFHTTALPPAKPALGFRLPLSSRRHSKVIGLGVWNKTYIPSWRWGSKREKWRGRLGCILKSPSCQLGTRIWVKCSSSGVRQPEFKTPLLCLFELQYTASVYWNKNQTYLIALWGLNDDKEKPLAGTCFIMKMIIGIYY